MIDAANLAWGNFPLLSHGATEALLHHGEAWQQERFLKPLVDGRWTGTMCLTEPHCGTDLGLLRTRAEPQGDGTLRDHRHQDLHHRRRARLHRQHRAPGAGAPARRACRQQGHLAVHRAQGAGGRGRLAGRAQRGALRQPRAQDGHPRFGHLRAELRRRRGLPRRPAAQGPDGHVHHDEHRAPRGRAAGPGPVGPRLPERAGLRARAAADARAVRSEVPRQAGRSDHRAPRRAPHAADLQGADRRRPRDGVPRRAAGRPGRTTHRTRPSASRPTRCSAS